MAGVSITFEVSGGGGSVSGFIQTTNATGVATVGAWTLGRQAGMNNLTARGPTTLPAVSFSATGQAGPPVIVSKVAGDNQTAAAGSTVPVLPAVVVKDEYENPVAGVSVTFAPIDGASEVSGGTPLTNQSGQANVASWKLGPVAGTNSLRVSVAGAPPVTFTATVTAPPQVDSALVGLFLAENLINLPPDQRNQWDGTRVSIFHKIFLPGNCPQTFFVANLGSPQSMMDYFVINENYSNGFIYQNNPGTVMGGRGARVTFQIHPDHVQGVFGGPPLILGSTQVLSVFTPTAKNFQKTTMSVEIRDYNREVMGSWSGTWSGVSAGRDGRTAGASGSWQLDVHSIDVTAGSINATLYWSGNDIVWTNNGTVPTTVPVNRTFTLNSSKASISIANNGCGILSINYSSLDPNGSYTINGSFDFDVGPNQVYLPQSHFHASTIRPDFTSVTSGNPTGAKR